MHGTVARDLEILGCTTASTWDDIKSAYRTLARRLHGELQRQIPGANERLVDINTAFDRLTGAWPARKPQPKPRNDRIAFDATVAAHLKAALRKATFRIAFDETRDPATGAYGDPRRQRKGGQPATAQAVRATRSGADLLIHVDQALVSGRTLIAVPELVLRGDGGLGLGAGTSILDCSLPRTAARVRVDASRLKLTGDAPGQVFIVQP